MGIELDQSRAPTRALRCNHGGAGAAERIQDNVTGPGGVADGAVHQGHRLHRRMQLVTAGLVEKPDVALVPGPAPEVVGAVLPAVEDGLVLALVLIPSRYLSAP